MPNYYAHEITFTVLTVLQKDSSLAEPNNHPNNQAVDLDQDWHNIQFLIMTSIPHNFDQRMNGTSLQNERNKEGEIGHFIASGKEDNLSIKRQIFIHNCDPIKHLAGGK